MTNSNFDPDLVKDFLIEAEETLSTFSTNLLGLEENPEDETLIASLFRSAHGIKGMSAMFGFTKIAELTHQMENVLDNVRKKKLAVNKDLINVLLEGYDLTNELFAEIQGDQAGAPIEIEDTVSKIKVVLEGESDGEENGSAVTINLDSLNTELKDLLKPFHHEEMSEKVRAGKLILEIRFSIMDAAMSTDINPITYFKIINLVGDMIVSTPIFFDVPALEDFDPQKNYFKIVFLIATSMPESKILGVFEDLVQKIEIKKIPSVVVEGEGDKEDLPLGEILKEKGKITEEDLEEALEDQKPKKLGEILLDKGKISSADLKQAVSSQKKTGRSLGQTLRVGQEKIDLFMALIGEQTIITSTISRIAKRLKGGGNRISDQAIDELYNSTIAGERIIDELQKSILKIRMVPLRGIFQNFPRIIRDISSKEGKEIDFKMIGEEIEIDKNIIDKINDPLVHMIRNSADHGVETLDERVAAGKSKKGTVHLRARIEDKFVVLEVQDDGKGMDLEKIKKKALEKGIATQQELDQMDKKQAAMLSFSAGLSTAATVTDISGRGVGMDIVMSTIKELCGEIDVETNLGQGTLVTMRIPINLGILEKMLLKSLIVGQEEELYAVPIDGIVETLNIRSDEVSLMRNKEAIYLRGEVLGIVNLSDIIHTNGTSRKAGSSIATNASVVIITDGNQRLGIVVDRLLGQQSVVIKPLQELLHGINELKGATILGDGRVILILDTEMLLKRAALHRAISKKEAAVAI